MVLILSLGNLISSFNRFSIKCFQFYQVHQESQNNGDHFLRRSDGFML
uniref:Uncharacterized protein n=1 Tax=Myoviridae sp. ctCo31 TaxID=2825053 RepID=A0A8S5UME0_9CAUD|nr:MAG TPA: hypothetical protein [Myoviridae sp. ctCo31]